MRDIRFRVKSRWNSRWLFMRHAEPTALHPKWDLETIGQFTGLKDKNGKEIYEGDILSVHPGEDGNWYGKVLWHDRDCRFYVLCKWEKSSDCGIGRSKHDVRSIAEKAEVAGNMYKHPSLLTPEAPTK